MHDPLNPDGYGLQPQWDEPQQDDIVIRHSTVSSMDLCPLRVGLQTVDGYDPVSSPQMVFGTLVHELIALGLGAGRSLAVSDLTNDAISSLLSGLSRQDGTGEPEVPVDADPALVAGMVDEARTAYLLWVEQIWPDIEDLNWLAIERRLAKPLGVLGDGRAVWLSGTPDALAGEPRGFDWKTSGRAWPAGRLKVETQPSAYTWLSDFDELAWSYAVYDRGGEQWLWHDTYRTVHQAEAFARHAYTRAVQIGYGMYPATPVSKQISRRGWWCSAKFCNAWEVCTAKDIGDDVDVLEERTSGWKVR